MKNYRQYKIALAALFAVIVISGCSFRDKTLDGNTEPPVDWGTAIIPKITFADPAPGVSIQTPYTMKISITDDGMITNAYIIFVGQTNALNFNTTNGYYEYDIQSMPDGLHSAIAVAVDDDGNMARNAMTVIVANPSGTPSILWTKPAQNAWITSGVINGTYYVNNGTLLAVNAVSVLTNGVFAGYAAYGSGNWSYPLDVSAIPDSNTVSLSVIAAAKGDKAATNTISVKIDNETPSAALTLPADLANVANTGFTISGSSADGVSGISSTVVSIPGIWQTNLGAGAFSFAFPGVLYGGTNRLIVTAADKAGLVKSVTNRIIAVYLPQSSLTNPAPDKVFTSSSAAFAGKASMTGGYTLTGLTVKASNTTVMIISNKSLSGTSANWAQSIDISALAEGAFYVMAYASANGTNNAAFASWTRFYKDTLAPTNFINTATVATNAKNILFSISGYSYDGGSGIDRVLVVVSNYAGVATNTLFGFGVSTLNWDKEVFVRLGTNLIKVSTVDKAAKVSTVMQKKVVCNRAITIDGANDFDNVSEKFSTTAADYYTYVSWNANNIYLGFEGADVGANDASKWILIYISTNTNDALGNKQGVGYNTQTPYLPFKAQYHLGLQLLNTGGVINESYGAGWAQSGWFTEAGHLYRTGNYFEVCIPLSDIGGYSKYYVTAFMVNELAMSETTYAKLYGDNLADGYGTHLTKYIAVNIPDITTAPNSAGFKKTGDLIPPTVSITSPADGSSTTNVNVAVSGTAADTGSSVQSVYLNLDGGTYRKVTGTASWSTNLTGLSIGTHTNKVYAVDTAGNSSATNTAIFTVVAGFNTYHTLIIDGDIDFYPQSEYLGTNGVVTIGAAITWDDTYLYIVISNKNFAGDTAARLNFYLSTNTNAGTAYCFDYDGLSGARAHPHDIKMQYNVEVYHNGSSGYAKLFRDDGAGWWNFTDLGVSDAYISWDASHTTSEVKIAWSKFNLSVGKQFWIYGFVANGGNDFVYAVWPTVNTLGEDSVNTSADKYYQFTITNGVAPNAAGNIKP